jgi:hypothetical protein
MKIFAKSDPYTTELEAEGDGVKCLHILQHIFKIH